MAFVAGLTWLPPHQPAKAWLACVVEQGDAGQVPPEVTLLVEALAQGAVSSGEVSGRR